MHRRRFRPGDLPQSRIARYLLGHLCPRGGSKQMRNVGWLLVAALVAGTGTAHAASDAALIKNAMSAAPRSIAKDATIVTFNEKMEMRVIRKGTNNFTCAPDDPT